MSSPTQTPDAKQQLTVQLPEGVKSGETITVKSPDNSYFEVVVPESAKAGDTLNILINKAAEEESADDLAPKKVESSSSSSSSTSTSSEPSSASASGGGGGGGVPAAEAYPPKSITQATIESAISSIFKRGENFARKSALLYINCNLFLSL